MDEMTSYMWNGLLTLGGAISLFFLKSHHATVQRLDILLNKTREEVARDYVSKDVIVTEVDCGDKDGRRYTNTKTDFGDDLAKDITRLHDRFDRLENKIDSLMKG